jgi:hypothetical protein
VQAGKSGELLESLAALAALTREKEEVTLCYFNIPKLSSLDHLEKHVALHLVKPLLRYEINTLLMTGKECIYLRFVVMIVITLVGTSHCHDNEVITRVETKIVDWWLEEVVIASKPFVEVDRWGDRHDVVGNDE